MFWCQLLVTRAIIKTMFNLFWDGIKDYDTWILFLLGICLLQYLMKSMKSICFVKNQTCEDILSIFEIISNKKFSLMHSDVWGSLVFILSMGMNTILYLLVITHRVLLSIYCIIKGRFLILLKLLLQWLRISIVHLSKIIRSENAKEHCLI